MNGRLFLFGAGGHAKVVIEALRAGDPSAELWGIDDDSGRIGGTFMGLRVSGGRDWLLAAYRPGDRLVAAIGDNRARLAVIDWAAGHGLALGQAIHPSAIVGASARIAPGAFLAPGAIVNADSRLGRGVIVNTGASVDHDCTVGDGVHVAPGARLCGSVVVEEGSLIGAGAIVAPGRRIGRNATVGAGTVVIRDVPDDAHVAGNPGRPMKRGPA